jgi:hypothetical protein
MEQRLKPGYDAGNIPLDTLPADLTIQHSMPPSTINKPSGIFVIARQRAAGWDFAQ